MPRIHRAPSPRGRSPGRPRRLSRGRGAIVGLAYLAIVLGACSGAAIPVRTFDPTSACTTDGRQAGAYPDLEATLPASYEGQPATSVDSGRNCTAAALGTLSTAGITSLRFAGAVWDLGGTSGLTVAVFDAAGLDAKAMIEFYAEGARANSKTEKMDLTDTTAGGRSARRLDVLQSDGAYHTVVAWPTATAGRVMVLLASDLGDAKVQAALAAFAAP